MLLQQAVKTGLFDQLQAGSEVRLVIAHDESEKGLLASTVKPIGKRHLIG